MGKKHPYYGKSMVIDFPDFPHTMGFVAFSRTVGSLWGNPRISHMLKYTLRWESNGKKSTHTIGKVWVSISQTFPIPWVLLHFPVLWEIYRETHAFPIWWHRLIFSCVWLEVTTFVILLATYPLPSRWSTLYIVASLGFAVSSRELAHQNLCKT